MSPAARNERTDHLLARTLTAGGLLAFALIATGSVMLALKLPHGELVLRVGVLALISTPVLRIVLAVFAFYLERDYKYMLIAAIVLGIVLIGAVLRVAV